MCNGAEEKQALILSAGGRLKQFLLKSTGYNDLDGRYLTK